MSAMQALRARAESACLVVVVTLCLVLASTHAHAKTKAMLAGPFSAEVLRVIDGDTLLARVTIWLDQTVEIKVRLRDVDTPELSAGCPRERMAAQRARDHLVGLASGKTITLSDISRAKYASRIIARAALTDGRDLSDLMMASQLGVPYAQRKQVNWC